MSRPLLTFALLVVITLARPTPASAGFWAWFEEWSGPGPAKGYTALWTACVQNGKTRPSPIGLNDDFHRDLVSSARSFAKGSITLTERDILKRLLANPDVQAARLLARAVVTQGGVPFTLEELNENEGVVLKHRGSGAGVLGLLMPVSDVRKLYLTPESARGPGHDDAKLACYFVDVGWFKAPDTTDPGNPAVGFPSTRTWVVDVGPSVRLHDGLDLGGGFGLARVSGDGFEAFNRGSITPLRLVLRPLLIAVPEHRRHDWMGILSVFWKETYFYGRLTGADFGVATPYAVDGELTRSFGLNIDLGSAFNALRR